MIVTRTRYKNDRCNSTRKIKHSVTFVPGTAVCLFAFLLFSGNFFSAEAKPNLDKLSDEDTAIVDSVLKKKQDFIKKKDAEGTLPLLTFKELYDGLEKTEIKFLKEILKLKPKELGVKTPFQGMSPDNVKLDKIDPQSLDISGKRMMIPAQYLRPEVYKSYKKMAEKMEKDIGKKLLIKSGFRSSAYQLYSFVLYLRSHKYSLKETASLNALPGYSEHGNIKKQAVDFISENGIDDDRPAEDFIRLKEYDWLVKNARRYGFIMSYPRSNPYGIAFEPWHWKYTGASKNKK